MEDTDALARIIVYSMAQDGIPAPESTAGSPMFTPLPSGVSTPVFMMTPVADYLSAPLSLSHQVFVGGSKALDSLARLIASTESFFHPSNSGSWTNDVSLWRRIPKFYNPDYDSSLRLSNLSSMSSTRVCYLP